MKTDLAIFGKNGIDKMINVYYYKIEKQKKAANKTFVYGVCDLWRAKKLQQWGRVQKKIPLI